MSHKSIFSVLCLLPSHDPGIALKPIRANFSFLFQPIESKLKSLVTRLSCIQFPAFPAAATVFASRSDYCSLDL